MITLTEEQFQLIQQYLELVRTINEAFSYVVTSFDDLSYTEGDVVLGDIFTALAQLEGTNTQLNIFFNNQVSVKDAINPFANIVQKVTELETVWDNIEARQQLIRENLSPMYATWSNDILQALPTYDNPVTAFILSGLFFDHLFSFVRKV